MEFFSAVSDYPTVILSVIVGATVFVITYIINLFNTNEENVQSTVTDAIAPKEAVDHATTSKHKKKHQNEKWNQKMSKQTYTHSWMVTSLKGHTGQVTDLDFSPNGKFLVTCAEDRAVFIWNTKDFASKEHKNVRYNIEFDHASHICWSPDSKAFVINRATENVLEVYKVMKTDGWISSITKAISFPKQFSDEVVGLGMAVNGRFIMCCSAANQLVVWDLKGAVLQTVDTCLLHTFRAKVSPCGRFVVASGFTPDVKVWEVVFAKTGEFKQVARAFELAGHTSGVYDFSFSSDSARMVTVSKDGSWKLYNTNIEFEKGEDPHLLITGKYSSGPIRSHLALSPNGEVVAIATGLNLTLYSALSGACDKVIDNIYPSGEISRVLFDSTGDHVLTAGEKHIRVFHNVTGRRTTIASSKLRLTTANNSTATKERLEEIISSAEAFLKRLKEPLVTKMK